MSQQIPRGPDNLYCPFWRKKMSLVCHTCPMWQKFRGENKSTGDAIDKWECAQAMVPALMIEVAQQARQGGAATESFRNEMVRLATSRQRHQLALQGE